MVLIPKHGKIDNVFLGWTIGDASTGVIGIIIFWCLYKRYYNVMKKADTAAVTLRI